MKKNVFSDNVQSISMLVYTEQYIKDDEALRFLCNANKLSGISIYFMPVLSNERKINLKVGEYFYNKQGVFTNVGINFPECSSIVSLHHHLPEKIDDKEIYRLSEDCIIHGQLISDVFDYVIAEENDN